MPPVNPNTAEPDITPPQPTPMGTSTSSPLSPEPTPPQPSFGAIPNTIQSVQISNPLVQAPSAEPAAQPAPIIKTSMLKKFMTKKMALIVSGSVIAIALLITGFVLLKGPLAQVASNLGIGGVSLKEYVSDKFKFSLKVPEGWETKIEDEIYDSLGFARVSMSELEGNMKSSTYGVLEISVVDSSKLAYRQDMEESKFFNSIKNEVQTNINYHEGTSTYSLESEATTTVNGLSVYKVKLKVVTNLTYEDDQTTYHYILAVFVSKTLTYRIDLVTFSSATDILVKADAILDSFKTL